MQVAKNTNGQNLLSRFKILKANSNEKTFILNKLILKRKIEM